MDVTVSSRNVELSEALRAAATEKIGRLDRYLEGMERAEVHFSEAPTRRPSDRDVCEVTMEGHGLHLRAKVTAPDAFAAVDAAALKLEHQLHRLKQRLVDRKHTKRRNGVSPAPGTDAGGEAASALRIAKSKRFSLEAMDPDEAAVQMELLAHDFFFFTNAETGRAAVLYRRGEGDLGLIDTDSDDSDGTM